ncbi:hypothetical protein [Burkholderia stabilis]|uniref:hypothetical protein n=1 Tax=Burkholderia stabilis TaxID=95485 RepID=UPI001F4A152A|nr:hypothetical protein [Burkholderia stabilis]
MFGTPDVGRRRDCGRIQLRHVTIDGYPHFLFRNDHPVIQSKYIYPEIDYSRLSELTRAGFE